MNVKAGDLIQVAYKRRKTTGFKRLEEYLIKQVIPGKNFVIVDNGNYTTTLDLLEIEQKVKKGKAKVCILHQNEMGGYDRMARLNDELKTKFAEFFMEKGISDDTMRDAVRTFQMSLTRVKAHIDSLGIHAALGVEKPLKKQRKAKVVPEALAADTSIGAKYEQDVSASTEKQYEAILASAMPIVRNRLKPTYLTGRLANYKVQHDRVIIANKQNEGLFIDVLKADIPEFIMEIDELLAILEESTDIAG